MAFDFLRLLNGERDFVLRVVVLVAKVELGSARAVEPLVEELVDVGVRGFFDGFGEIGGDHVFAAIHFEIVLQAAIESVLAKLVAEHVENPAAFGVGVAVEFAGIVEVVADDGLVIEIGLLEPFACGVPSLVVGLVFAEMRFASKPFP